MARRLNLITGIGIGVALISLVGAIIGLVFVGLSFRVSKQAAEDAEFATVTANRAWVKPDPPVFHDPFPSKIGDPILVYLPYEDLGKQIALNMQEYHEHEWVTPSNTSYLDLGPNTTCEKVTPSNISTIIWPGGAVPVYATHDKLNEIPRATTEFLAGSKWLVYRGCITYDTFEHTHYSKYCYFFNPTVNVPSIRGIGHSAPDGIKMAPIRGARNGENFPVRLFYAALTEKRRGRRNTETPLDVP